MLVVPLMELLMPAAVAAMALGYVSHALARLPVLIAGFALEGIAGTVRWLGGLRIADLRVPTPGTALILLSVLAIALAMALVRRRVWLAAGGLAALVASALWISAVPPHPQFRTAVLEMTAIDVGQGDRSCWSLPAAAPCWWTPEASAVGAFGSGYWRRRSFTLLVVACHHPPGRGRHHARACRSHGRGRGHIGQLQATGAVAERSLGPGDESLVETGAGTGGAHSSPPAGDELILAGRRCGSWLPARRTWLLGGMMNLW